MRRILYYVIGIAAVFYGWHRYQQLQLSALGEADAAADPAGAPVGREAGEGAYHCDGRVRCSQMHSCDEATWFLRNCPGVKLDGEGDGIPCERQWCGHH